MATLLSGWRIRLTDATNLPLQPGRACFFDSTTSLPKLVYADSDLLVPLGTEVEADLEGYLPAIWLADGFYDGYVQVKISEGPDVWDDLWDIQHLGVEVGTSTSTTIVRYVSTMADFRAMASASYDLAIVGGYYSEGDCGLPMQFRWIASSTKTDDGGAYIKHANQGFGAIGRSHQIFAQKDCDIRNWGGIPSAGLDLTASLMYCEQYATDPTWGVNPPAVCFPGNNQPGLSDYTFVGDVVLDAATAGAVKIKYKLGPGSRIQGLSHGVAITYSNPTEIDSDTPVYEYTNTVSFAAAALEVVKPQWFYGATVQDQLAAAKVVDAPLVLERLGEISLAAGTSNIFNQEVRIDDNSYILTGAGTTVEFRGGFVPGSQDGYYFLGTGTVGIYYAPEIRASWYGYGNISGNDQASGLQKALDCAQPNQTVILQPVVTSTKRILSAVYGNNNIIRPTTFIRVGAGGSISGVALEAQWHYQSLLLTDGGTVTLTNPEVSPYWFGVTTDVTGSGNSTNAAALTLALESCARGHNLLKCNRNETFVTNSVTSCTLTYNQVLRVSGLYIAPWSDTWTANETVLNIGGGSHGEFQLTDSYIGYAPGNALYAVCAKATIRLNQFDSTLTVSAADYVFEHNFVNNTLSTALLDPVGFSTASKKGTIASNRFSKFDVAIYGGTGTGAYLQNVNFNYNTITSFDDAITAGTLYVYSLSTATKVRGVNLDHNVWTTYGTGISRIVNAGIGGAATRPWADRYADLFTTHSISVKDNTISSYTATRDLLPTTQGVFRVSTTPTVVAASFYATKPAYVVFELTNSDQEYTQLEVRARGCTDGGGVFYVGGAAPFSDEIAATILIAYTNAVVGFENYFFVSFETYGNRQVGY